MSRMKSWPASRTGVSAAVMVSHVRLAAIGSRRARLEQIGLAGQARRRNARVLNFYSRLAVLHERA
jgi:hypothetical protein